MSEWWAQTYRIQFCREQSVMPVVELNPDKIEFCTSEPLGCSRRLR